MTTTYKPLALILIIVSVIRLNAFAQTALQKADKFYNNFEYAFAIDHYKKALEMESTLKSTEKLAECCRLTNNSKEAEVWYGKALTYPGYDPVNIYYYAEALRSNGKYPQAKAQYLLYGEKVPGEITKVNRLIQSCDLATQWMSKPEPIDVENQVLLNSSGTDYSMAYYADEIIFVSDRSQREAYDLDKNKAGGPENSYSKIYTARKDSATTGWKDVIDISEVINTKYHNGPAVFSKNANLIYFTRAKMVRKKNRNVNNDPTSWVKKENPEFINHLEIYLATKEGDTWTNIKPFTYNNVTEYSVGHPALSADGRMLYFVSDMPGGFGETDIYFCEKTSEGNWSKPVNLGKEINTTGKELFPVINEDSILYFASNGHMGMGGLDMFAAKGSYSKWMSVANLKYPFNSPKDDFGILFDKTSTSGYFSSNRDDGAGSDDIYSFTLKKTVIPASCVLSGFALELNPNKNEINKETPLAEVLLRLYKDGESIPVEIYSDSEGRFFFDLQQGSIYEIKGLKEGYFTQVDTIIADCQSPEDSIQKTLFFKSTKQDKPKNEKAAYALKNIYYDLDKSNIKYDAAKELDNIVNLLARNPQIIIELNSHADSRASDEYNLELSQRRAQAAANYMISKGIDENRIVAKGYGRSRLINHCKDGIFCTEEYHRENRRTELKIIQGYQEVKK